MAAIPKGLSQTFASWTGRPESGRFRLTPEPSSRHPLLQRPHESADGRGLSSAICRKGTFPWQQKPRGFGFSLPTTRQWHIHRRLPRTTSRSTKRGSGGQPGATNCADEPRCNSEGYAITHSRQGHLLLRLVTSQLTAITVLRSQVFHEFQP
jgi:hypothetical protein